MQTFPPAQLTAPMVNVNAVTFESPKWLMKLDRCSLGNVRPIRVNRSESHKGVPPHPLLFPV